MTNANDTLITALVTELITHGYSITITNEEDTPLTTSTDIHTITNTLHQTENEWLHCSYPDNTDAGYIWINHNHHTDPTDLITDYTTNLHHHITHTLTTLGIIPPQDDQDDDDQDDED